MEGVINANLLPVVDFPFSPLVTLEKKDVNSLPRVVVPPASLAVPLTSSCPLTGLTPVAFSSPLALSLLEYLIPILTSGIL